ncbi:MAG: DUF2934 domain-containing protein [Candidatus Omnitrophica bacterium]|nr:DUF2934 domain-containing protein [Candidatus Omnitrophota bacterium]
MSLQEPSTPRNKLRRAKSLLPQKETTRTIRQAVATHTSTKTSGAPKTSVASSSSRINVALESKTVDSVDVQQRIAEKAYELFQLRGYSHGLDKYDWELADKLVRLEGEKSNSKKNYSIDLEDEETKQLIAQKAYDLYVQKGCVEGTKEYDWHVAQQLVKYESK